MIPVIFMKKKRKCVEKNEFTKGARRNSGRGSPSFLPTVNSVPPTWGAPVARPDGSLMLSLGFFLLA